MAPTTTHHADHDHDDGLVHGHGWASSIPVGSAPGRLHQPPAWPSDHDDGLVHDHGWARS